MEKSYGQQIGLRAASVTDIAISRSGALRTQSVIVDNFTKRRECPQRFNRHPKNVHDTLLNWLKAHLEWPYPTVEEKRRLSRCTGLTYVQVIDWFTNARRRLVPRMLEAENARRAKCGQPPLALARKTWIPVERAVLEKLRQSRVVAVQQGVPVQASLYPSYMSASMPQVHRFGEVSSLSHTTTASALPTRPQSAPVPMAVVYGPPSPPLEQPLHFATSWIPAHYSPWQQVTVVPTQS